MRFGERTVQKKQITTVLMPTLLQNSEFFAIHSHIAIPERT